MQFVGVTKVTSVELNFDVHCIYLLVPCALYSIIYP